MTAMHRSSTKDGVSSSAEQEFSRIFDFGFFAESSNYQRNPIKIESSKVKMIISFKCILNIPEKLNEENSNLLSGQTNCGSKESGAPSLRLVCSLSSMQQGVP